MKYNEYGLLDQLQRKWYDELDDLEKISIHQKKISQMISIKQISQKFIMGFPLESFQEILFKLNRILASKCDY